MRAGYNHDIVRGGRRLHVQTEDLGGARRRVVSQVFADGRVVATRAGDYPAGATAAGGAAVQRLMREQHRGLLRAVLRGEIDG